MTDTKGFSTERLDELYGDVDFFLHAYMGFGNGDAESDTYKFYQDVIALIQHTRAMAQAIDSHLDLPTNVSRRTLYQVVGREYPVPESQPNSYREARGALSQDEREDIWAFEDMMDMGDD